jgi:hypothetical protein
VSRLEQKVASAAASLASQAAEIHELRASLAEVRRPPAEQTDEIRPEILEATSQLLTELRRAGELPDRLQAQAELLRRLLGLSAVLEPQEIVADAPPELFDFVGDPTTDPASGRVLRSAWVTGDETDGVRVVLRGAVLWT